MLHQICAVIVYSALLLVAGCDTVRVANVSTDVGLLVDGGAGGGTVNDRRRARDGSSAVTINVGNLSSIAAPGRNETIAFGFGRSPRRADMGWTTNNDDLDMALGDPIGIQLTIWIVQGPFAAQRDHAFLSCVQTLAILVWERTGLQLNGCDIRDATTDPDITSAMLDSTGGDNRNWSDYSNLIGSTAGRINVYWINTVDGATTSGSSDFGGRIVMGRDTGLELLVHELGHGLSLRHPVATCADTSIMFDDTNIMWGCSNDREFITEGQVFRIHFNPASSLNELYAARPGQPTEGCVGAGETSACPALERRLWVDGAYANN